MSEKNNNGESVEYVQAIDVKIGGYLVIDGFPCKVVDRSVSKTGKHGGCKINFVGIDIFTQKKHTTIYRSSDTVQVPIVTKEDYQLMNIEDGEPEYLALMSNNQELREDIPLPKNDLGNQIRTDFLAGKDIFVTVQKAMTWEAVISHKINKQI